MFIFKKIHSPIFIIRIGLAVELSSLTLWVVSQKEGREMVLSPGKLHMNLRELFIARLADLGIHEIDLKSPGRDKIDFETKEGIRVALRFSGIRPRIHRVRHGQRRYTYRYASCLFNFHRRGCRVRGVDVFFCAVQGGPDFFCIPASKIEGKTFCLTYKEESGMLCYRGQYRQYMNTLSGLREVIEERAATG